MKELSYDWGTSFTTATPEDLVIHRKKRADSFQYLLDNKPISDMHLPRITALAVPPAWKEVLISTRDDSHIQAVGFDTSEKKQYIYHPAWSAHQQALKFERLVIFGRKLSELRQACDEKLTESQDWNRSKVLALTIAILDNTGIRIGNGNHTTSPISYGLTTLRRKHVQSISESSLLFEYRGKAGVERKVKIDDPLLSQLVFEVSDEPGYEIFRYKEKGKWHNVTSDDVNQEIKQVMGEDISSKDFRTWAANRYAMEKIPEALTVKKENCKKELLTILSEITSTYLGNTPAVCRSSYLHPSVCSFVDAPELEAVDSEYKQLLSKADQSNKENFLSVEERALLEVIS